QPAAGHLARVLDAFGFEVLGQFWVFDARRRELLRLFGVAVRRLFQGSANHLIADVDLGHIAVLQMSLDLGIGQCSAVRRQVVHLREAEQQQKGESVPQRRRRTLTDTALSASIGVAHPEAGTGFLGRRHVSPFYALTASRFSQLSASVPASTVTVSPSTNAPSRTRIARGSRTRRWIVRLSGRAP